MLDCVMLDRAFGDNENNGIKHIETVDVLYLHLPWRYFSFETLVQMRF